MNGHVIRDDNCVIMTSTEVVILIRSEFQL